MRIVRKNVYYCDFCKKKGLSRYHLEEHEGNCTGNVNRCCGMCNNKVDYGPMIERFKGQMKSHDTGGGEADGLTGECFTYKITTIQQKPGLDEIFDSVEDCPACVLTILRACGLCGHEWEMGFDWKTEKDKWWSNNKPPMDEY